MELKEFIKTALSDITNAVSELQTELQNGAIVSPSVSNPITNVTVIDPQDDKINRPISKIDFDVAITVGSTDNTEAGGKVGIQIFSAKLGGNTRAILRMFQGLHSQSLLYCLTSMLKIGQNGMRKNVQNVLFKLTIRI